MPLIVLLVFYALHRVQHPPPAGGAFPAATAPAQSSAQQ